MLGVYIFCIISLQLLEKWMCFFYNMEWSICGMSYMFFAMWNHWKMFEELQIKVVFICHCISVLNLPNISLSFYGDVHLTCDAG